MCRLIRRFVLPLGVSVLITACPSAEAPPAVARAAPDGASATTSDSIRAHMQAFLTLGIATRAPQGAALDSVYLRTTGTGEEWTIWDDQDRRRWIADGRVVGISHYADSAIVSVALTVVADQEPNLESADAGYLATISVREDTARWVMVRDRENTSMPSRWKVRGGALEGFSVLAFGRTIKWTTGGSEAIALGLVDSIRTARGLQVVR